MLDDRTADEMPGDRRTPAADTSRTSAPPITPPRPTDAKQGVAAPRKPLMSPVRQRIVGMAGLAALLWAATLLVSYWTVGRFQVSTDDAYVGARAALVSSKIAGYVTEVVAADNAVLKTGDLIARVDPGDYQLAVRAAQDLCQTQRSTVARITKQIAAQQSMVDQARAQVTSAKAAATKGELDMVRQNELAARKINSAATMDQARATRDQAVAAVQAANAAVAAAAATVAVYEAQRTEAENLLRQNETAQAKAERDLSFADIRAPFDGVFGNRAVQVGDYVQPAQRLASLIPLRGLYIDANFKETQLSRLKPGQAVRVTVDAQAGKEIDGQVVSIAPASGSVFSLLPPDNATGNFTKVVQRVPVRISIPDEVVAQGLLRPGMSVVVSVNTKSSPMTRDAAAVRAP